MSVATLVMAAVARKPMQPMTLPTNPIERSTSTPLSCAPLNVGKRIRLPQTVQVSTASMSTLRAELNRQPEVRADVVARAKALTADPNYPSLEVLRNVADLILRAPDLSEDQS